MTAHIRLWGGSRSSSAGSGSTFCRAARARSCSRCSRCNRERPVPRGELIAALWPDRPPADPDEALSALLSKVRQAVGRDVLTGRRELSLALPGGAEVDVEQARLGRRPGARRDRGR